MAETLTKDGTLGAADADVRLSVGGLGGVAIQVQGTFSGTITFEASVQGQDFTAFRVTPVNSSTPVTTTTTTGLWVGSVVGFLVVRARMSSYASGQAIVHLKADLAAPGGSSSGGGAGSDINLIEVGGASIALGQAAMAASLPVVIASDQSAVDVNIVGGGGSGGTSSDFGDPFPTAGTAIGVADPDGNMAALSAETFDYDTGAGTVAQTALGLVTAASGGPLPVPGGSGTATGALRVELPTNGTGVIATVGAVTAITNALPAGTNVIGHVIADSGSTTAVTGNVTVVQPTGSNLHVVTDSGTITTVSTVTSVTAIANALPAGNNNIGDVDVASLPALPAGNNNIGDVDVASLPALPAGANTIGAVTNVPLTNFGAGEYETVAASQTAQVLGPTGAMGDFVMGLLVVPATTSPGNVLLLDNATSITVFAGGASSVSNLVPFFIPLGIFSVSGAWKVTTGANVSVIGVGNFT